MEMQNYLDGVYKTISAASVYYARCYIYFTGFSAISGDRQGFLYMYNTTSAASFSSLCQAEVDNVGGTIEWALATPDGSFVYGGTPQLDTWFCVEVEFQQNTLGGAQMWVNGLSIGSCNGTTLNWEPQSVYLLDWNSAGAYTPMYADDAVIANSYIGPISATVQLAVTSAYGSPNPSGTASYLNGTNVSASVTSPVPGPPGTQYVCTGWNGTGDAPASGSGTTVNFTITQNSTITWNWKTQYSVSFSVAPPGGGSTTPTGNDIWEDEGPLPLSAEANVEYPYLFSQWSSNTTSITFLNPNSSSTTATIEGPGTITANFTPVQRYSLIVNVVGNGTVTESPDGFTFVSGNTVGYLFVKGSAITLTAVPDVNWAFQGWNGSLSGKQNPVNVTMDQSVDITATFVQVPPYTLTVKVVGNGTVTVTPSAATYFNGTVVTLTALPSVNWAFINWTGDLASRQSQVNLTMSANKTVTATFIQYFTLTVSVVGNGTVMQNSSGPYLSGANVTLTAVPSVDWRFWNWSGGGSGQQNQTSIIMGGNITVTATFGLIWDINRDGKVSLADLVLLAKAYGSHPGAPNWNPDCAFVAPYNVIDLSDLVTLAMHYGEHT
jgi:hypothetical protein